MSDPVKDPERVYVVLSWLGKPLAWIEDKSCKPISSERHITEYISLAAHEAALAEQVRRVAELEAELRRKTEECESLCNFLERT